MGKETCLCGHQWAEHRGQEPMCPKAPGEVLLACEGRMDPEREPAKKEVGDEACGRKSLSALLGF